MNLTYNTTTIFPTIIHQFDIGGFEHIKEQLIDYSYNLKNKDPEGTKLSNHGGWQSTSFPVTTKEDVLQSLLINCLSKFPSVSESVNITISAWVNINKTGDYNVRHVHPDCDLSGVLWIKCPPNSGAIRFVSPYEFQDYNLIKSYTEDFKNENNFNQKFHVTPTEGKIIIFPSHLHHLVEENKSNDDRISVSFNLKLNKDIGTIVSSFLSSNIRGM